MTLLAKDTGDRVLYRLLDRLFRAQTIAESYEAALDGMFEGLGASRAAILIFDPTRTMQFVASRGLSATYRAATTGHSPWIFGEREATPVYIERADSAGFDAELRNAIAREGISALAFIPLITNEGVIGKFMLYYDEPHVFSTSERWLAQALARQLSHAIERDRAGSVMQRLSAIVRSSDDAIVSKDLDGIVTSWNCGAERLFGFTAEDMIGRSILTIIPEDRYDEEPTILARIRAGKTIDHYETVRQHRDGHLIDISLTVSPIKDASGQVIGASKIARDISERRRTEARQQLLLQEMNHRIKNLFTLASSIVRLSCERAETATQLAEIVSARLEALARAHALTTGAALGEADRQVTLHGLIQAITAPYDPMESTGGRIRLSGADRRLKPEAVTPLSLLLHEFATNAAKYGSFSTTGGHLDLTTTATPQGMRLDWSEFNTAATDVSEGEGFGTRLVKSAGLQLGGLERHFRSDGVDITITILDRWFGEAA